MKSINHILLMIVGLVASSCGHQKVVEIDAELAVYVEEFQKQYFEVNGKELEIDDLIVKFGELRNPKDTGLCEYGGDKTPTITLSRQALEYMDELAKEAVIFHEMGHCVLKQNHDKEYNDDGTPASLMYPYVQPVTALAKNWDQMVVKLMTAKKDFE